MVRSHRPQAASALLAAGLMAATERGGLVGSRAGTGKRS
jgi:hypothetical protein